MIIDMSMLRSQLDRNEGMVDMCGGIIAQKSAQTNVDGYQRGGIKNERK